MIRGKSIWLAFTQFQTWTRGEFHVEKEVFVLMQYVVIKQDVIYCRYLTMWFVLSNAYNYGLSSYVL